MGDERRAAHRFPMSLPLVVRAPARGQKSSASTQTNDISASGVYFDMNENFRLGSRIEFVVTLPREITPAADVRIRCLGRVVRVEKEKAAGAESAERRIGVAAAIEQYEFLPPVV